MAGDTKSGPSKIYEFQLLKRNKLWGRFDVYPLFSTSFLLYYNYGTRIFDREELVPVLMFMLAIICHSLLFFVNFWSADLNVFFAYSKIDDIQDATDIWIRLENKK